MPTMPPGPDFDQQLHAEQVENARLADLWRDVSGEVHRLRGGDRPDDQPVDDQEVMYAVLTALRTPAPAPVRPVRHEAVVQVNVKDVERTVRQVMDRDAADAQRWRAVRDEVLRLDQIARPSSSGVVMADDDVEPLVLDVLRRHADPDREKRVQAALRVALDHGLPPASRKPIPPGHVCAAHGDPDPSGICDWAHEQAAGRGNPGDYADGQLAGDRDRMARCKEDLARALHLPPRPTTTAKEYVWANLLSAVRVIARAELDGDTVETVLSRMDRPTSSLHFVCTALPGPGGECVFVELEDDAGRSVYVGEWRHREDGLVELLVPQVSDVTLECRHVPALRAGDIAVLTLATDTPSHVSERAIRLLKVMTDTAGAHGVVLCGGQQDFTVIPARDPKLHLALIQVLDAAAVVCGTFAGSDRSRREYENLTQLVLEATWLVRDAHPAPLAKE